MINPENANKIPNRGVVFFSGVNHIHVSVIIDCNPPESLSSADALLGQVQGVGLRAGILPFTSLSVFPYCFIILNITALFEKQTHVRRVSRQN